MTPILYITSGEVKANIIIRALRKRYPKFVLLATGCPHFMTYFVDGNIGTHDFINPRVQSTSFSKYLHSIFPIVGFFIAALLGLRKLHSSRYNVCIAESPISALPCILLKQLGLARKSIFYVQDWYPYPEEGAPIMTTLRRLVLAKIELLDFVYSDGIWANNDKLLDIHFGEKSRKISEAKIANAKVVPILFEVPEEPVNHLEGRRKNILYIGGISKHVGFDLCFQAISVLRKRQIEISFDIAGTEADLSKDSLISMARKYGVEDRLFFHGHLRGKQLFDLIRGSSVGLLVFSRGDKNYYAYSIPGKVRDYLINGVPVIISKENVAAVDIETAGAGIGVDYNINSLVNAILRTVEDTSESRSFRQNSLDFARKQADPTRLFTAMEDSSKLRDYSP